MKEKLTSLEKISLLNGKTNWLTQDIERVGLKSIFMADGPHGVRKELSNKETSVATLFPSEATIACSFNKDLAYEMGKAISEEAKNLDVDMILAPGVNIKRNPRCGRNFEYYSEDPVHTGKMAQSFILGMQDNNVSSCVKHFAVNSQETYRLRIDSVVDERALREIYLKAFKYASDVKVDAVMASYNKINGTYGCENKYLLKDILRDEFKFDGLVISDWGAVNDPVLSVKNGLNLEMPNSKDYNLSKIREAYFNKKITDEEISYASSKLIEYVQKKTKPNKTDVDMKRHHLLAQKIAKDSIVLLKNDGILPFKKEEKILVVGDFAKHPRYQGYGSSKINPYMIETLLGEIDNYTKNYSFLRGFSSSAEESSHEENKELLNEVLSNASKFDKVLIMIATIDETEGLDRSDILLPKNQLKLIEEVAKINSNIVVSLSLGSAVEMPFYKDVKGIINCYLLGQANGVPLLDILYGVVSPSGRLCETYAHHLEDYITSKNFANSNNSVHYEESIFVGYRYFETFNKDVLFPFGYGLSYSKFDYSDLKVSDKLLKENQKIIVRVTVKNTGLMKASEVVMLFVEKNISTVYKAKRELKDFAKILLDVNEEKVVEFVLDYDDFSYYDIYMKKNHVDKGTYKIQICKNAHEVILEEKIEKEENDSKFLPHEESIYNQDDLVLSSTEFSKLFKKPLPEKNVVFKKPYTMNSTGNDFKNSFTGRIIYRQMIKMAKNQISDDMTPSEKRSIIVGAMEIPLRTIAFMAGDQMNYIKAEGIVDMANGKFIKGLKKYFKKD